eukprot:3121744-Pleurochrysis_carterae.AAC.1
MAWSSRLCACAISTSLTCAKPDKRQKRVPRCLLRRSCNLQGSKLSRAARSRTGTHDSHLAACHLPQDAALLDTVYTEADENAGEIARTPASAT